MTQSRILRTNLPESLKNPEAIKALSKRILKLYINKRIKEWDSVTGIAKGVGKTALAVFSLGKYGSVQQDTWRILNDCDEIKREIEGLTCYADIVKLISKLEEKAIKAIGEQVPGVSNPSLRAHTYYAIISLLQDLMKVQFPEEYLSNINQLVTKLEFERNEIQTRFSKGLAVDGSYKIIDDVLRQMVMLGYRDIYWEAFAPYRRLFPHFTPIADATYINQSDNSTYTQWIKTQRLQETARINQEIKLLTERFNALKVEQDFEQAAIVRNSIFEKRELVKDLTDDQLPNPNIPYHLQPSFALLYLKSEHEESLAESATVALGDLMIKSDRTFHAQYVADPKTFQAKNNHADAKDMIQAMEAQKGHETDVHKSPDEDELGFEEKDDLELPKPDDLDLHHQSQQSEQAPTDERMHDNTVPNAEGNNIPEAPAPEAQAPVSPSVSRLGQFAPPPPPPAPVIQQVNDAGAVEEEVRPNAGVPEVRAELQQALYQRASRRK